LSRQLGGKSNIGGGREWVHWNLEIVLNVS
jgi:hypothetical protein